MRLVGTVIRSRNVGRQMAVVETWMEVRRLAFPLHDGGVGAGSQPIACTAAPFARKLCVP